MFHTGSWVWDIQREAPVYWSEEMCRLHGRHTSDGPPTRVEFGALYKADTWAGWLAAVEHVRRNRKELDFSCRLALPDGVVRELRMIGQPICGGAGDVTEIIGSATEISVHQAQRAVQHPPEQAIDLIPALAWSTGPDGTCDFSNRTWLEYTGLTVDEASGWGWSTSFHPDDIDAVLAYWHALRSSGEAGEIEARMRRFDGEYRWFLVRAKPLTDADGVVVKWYGTNTDIEDRKRAEEAVRDSEFQLRLIIDSIPALVFTTTAAGEVEYVNRQILDYFGNTLEELKNWAFSGAVHPDDMNGVVTHWQHSIAGGSPFDIEQRIRRFDGVFRWFHVRGLPLRSPEGRIIRWYVVLTDVDDRVRSEEAVRISERELRQIVDSVPGMIATANAKGEHDYASKRTLDYTGTSTEEASGLGFVNTIHPDDQELVKQMWIRSVTLGQPMEINHRWRRFDGVYRWFRVRVHPRVNEKGEIVRWYGLLTDIDDQMQAEEALRNSEQHLRLLVETLPAVVWRATKDGSIDYANGRLGEYLGSPRNFVKGDEWIAELHPEDVDVTLERWKQSCRAGSSYDTMFRLRRADGEYRWVQMIGEPLRDTAGQILNWYGLMLDIDDRRRAEQALREREAQLRGVLETVPALVTRTTSEGRLEYVNRRVVDFLGGNVEEIGSAAIHPEDRDTYLKKWSNCLETGQPCEATYRLRRIDGEYRWFFVRIEPLRDTENQVASWYTVHIDVDDSRKIAEELRHTQAKLSQASQIATVAELSASIAHEINQPLAAIVANGHACHAWLSNDPPNLIRARLTAERIITNGNSAAEVVRRIRALFKQNAPELVLASINDIAVEVLTLMADETRDHGIFVATDLAADVPMIPIDRVQLQQVLVNLVHNAIEAMEGIADRPKELLLLSQCDAPDIRFEVRDRGRGLAHPKSVFDPFFTTKENGMGMGLAICRSIIETHGGRLWATPNSQDGTTFGFTLPLPLGTQP